MFERWQIGWRKKDEGFCHKASLCLWDRMYGSDNVGMLSVCPLSGLHGAFHAVFAWITVLIILGMYILNFIPIQDFEGKIRNTGLILYYLSCFVWYVGITAYFFKARS